VPCATGIQLRYSISVSYFVLSLLSLLFLKLLYMVASDGVGQLMGCIKYTAMVYGVIVFTCGILIFAIEVPALPASVSVSWTGMSLN
jgi:hypothetical protein